jgi:hypothetical protein
MRRRSTPATRCAEAGPREIRQHVDPFCRHFGALVEHAQEPPTPDLSPPRRRASAFAGVARGGGGVARPRLWFPSPARVPSRQRWRTAWRGGARGGGLSGRRAGINCCRLDRLRFTLERNPMRWNRLLSSARPRSRTRGESGDPLCLLQCRRSSVWIPAFPPHARGGMSGFLRQLDRNLL